MAGDALDFRIVDGVGGKLVVRRQPFEHRRFLENQIGIIGRMRRHGAQGAAQRQERQRVELENRPKAPHQGVLLARSMR
jgi:hypothetical protein